MRRFTIAFTLTAIFIALPSNVHAGRSLTFEGNWGQASPEVRFLARTHGYDLYLTREEAILQVHTLPGVENAAVRVRFEGFNGSPSIVGESEQPAKVNYFLGADPRGWIKGVPTYDRIRYEQALRGVDVVLYGNEHQLEYDLVLAPGTDPASIRLKLEGADQIHIDENGDLVLSTAAGELVMRRPVSYQEDNGRRVELDSGYSIENDSEVGFWVAPHDEGKSLTIDPVFAFSTYLGGSGDEIGNGIDVDSAGNVFVTGRTSSINFPTVSPSPSAQGRTDAFVTKLNSAGQLQYSTYFGGSGDDAGLDIKVDFLGIAYVVGTTDSTSLPFLNTLLATYGGLTDGFLAKFDSFGVPTFSRYIGGVGDDIAAAVRVDIGSNIYVAVTTFSPNFTNSGTPLTTSDAYVVKFTPGGSIVYQTVLGGTADDAALALNLDPAGQVYATGVTQSREMAIVSGLQVTFGGGTDCFIVRLNPIGAVAYSTFLGGAGNDSCSAITVDSTGIYVAGTTTSANFPTSRPAQPSNRGGQDAFVTKLNTPGSTLVYSTYLGGTGDDNANDLATDSSGAVFVVGNTTSTNFPNVNAYQLTNSGGTDVFTTKIDAAGALVAASYLGGSFDDFGNALKLDGAGNVHITGSTASADFPIFAAVQSTRLGALDAFIARIAETEFRPKNDDFSNAISITGATGTTTGSNVGAGLESKEAPPARAGRTSVWWRWIPPFTGTAMIDTIGSDFDTILGIFRGTELGNLAAVTSDDDSGGGGTSLATFAATENVTYFIAVNGFSSASGHIVLHWNLNPPPLTGTVNVAGFPNTIPAGQQQAATIALGTRYPLPLTGQLVISFTPDVTLTAPSDDPAIQFATGGRSVSFTIPANTTQSVFPDGASAVAFQTGTVAGTITFRVALQVFDQNITPTPEPRATTTVNRQPPAITNITVNNISNSAFELVITGYSTPRQISQAVFAFTALPGATLRNGTLTVDLSSVFIQWYQSASSQQFGSQFKLTMPFTLPTGTRTNLAGVGVTLVNGIGPSNVFTRGF